MFSLFKKEKPSFSIRDKVWKTAESARKGLLMMAMMRLQQQQRALIVSFFEEDKIGLISFMNENKITYKDINAASSDNDLDTAEVHITGEGDLKSSVVQELVRRNANRYGPTVFFQCHYPIIAEEEKVLGQLTGLGFSDFVFCLSFDDPMLASIKGNIVQLLERLGLDENESIEHNLVTGSIKNIRIKLNQKVKNERKAKSAAEWFAWNVK